jgi:CheY-like chemotaxis protein
MPKDSSQLSIAALCRVIDELDESYLDFPFGLILCDHDRGLRYAALSFLNLLGQSLQQASGLAWLEQLTPDSRRAVDRWRDCGDNHCDWEQELQLRDCRGSLRTLLVHAQYVCADESYADTWVIVYLDITDRRIKLQSERRAREFAEGVIRALPNPVAVLHSSHRIIAANPAFQHLFSDSRFVATGESLHGLLSGSNSTLVLAIDRLLEEGVPFDEIPAQVTAKERPSARLLVSGRRLIVPDHEGPAAVLSFAIQQDARHLNLFPTNDSVQNSSDGDGCSYRVLVVDDSESDAFLLSQVLSVMGHEVVVAHNAEDALRHAERFSPDLVVTDIAMPGVNGFELAMRLRTRNGSKNILLVALTGYDLEADGDELSAAGFDLLLTKPVEITKLQSLIDLLASRC